MKNSNNNNNAEQHSMTFTNNLHDKTLPILTTNTIRMKINKNKQKTKQN